MERLVSGGCRSDLAVLLCLVGLLLTGCGSSTPGRMEWVTPHNLAPRVGTAYFIRGWKGVFSPGIDEMAAKVNAAGVTAVVFMPEQFPELAAAMVERYRGDAGHEPIILVGHSRGVDSSVIIAWELQKAGVKVDLIVGLDSVDETTAPPNVAVFYNYWMRGYFGENTNLFRGIPLVQAPGSKGKLYNIDLDHDGRSMRGVATEHISMDNDSKVQKEVIKHILEACPERSGGGKDASGNSR